MAIGFAGNIVRAAGTLVILGVTQVVIYRINIP